MRSIKLSNSAYQTFLKIAGSGTKTEKCGFVLGYPRSGQVLATKVVSVRNSYQGQEEFAIAEYERRYAFNRAKTLGLHVLAVFHTHQDCNTNLSESDMTSLSVSDLPWMVISLYSKVPPCKLHVAAYSPNICKRIEVIFCH